MSLLDTFNKIVTVTAADDAHKGEIYDLLLGHTDDIIEVRAEISDMEQRIIDLSNELESKDNQLRETQMSLIDAKKTKLDLLNKDDELEKKKEQDAIQEKIDKALA